MKLFDFLRNFNYICMGSKIASKKEEKELLSAWQVIEDYISSKDCPISCGIHEFSAISFMARKGFENEIEAKELADKLVKWFAEEASAFVMISVVHPTDEDEEFDFGKSVTRYLKMFYRHLKEQAYAYVPYQVNPNSNNRINIMIFKGDI